MDLGTVAVKGQKSPANSGFEIDGERVMGKKPNALLKGREKAIKSAIDYNDMDVKHTYSGKRGSSESSVSTKNKVKSTVTVTTITYE